jgi:hypothetical protein
MQSHAANARSQTRVIPPPIGCAVFHSHAAFRRRRNPSPVARRARRDLRTQRPSRGHPDPQARCSALKGGRFVLVKRRGTSFRWFTSRSKGGPLGCLLFGRSGGDGPASQFDTGGCRPSGCQYAIGCPEVVRLCTASANEFGETEEALSALVCGVVRISPERGYKSKWVVRPALLPEIGGPLDL